MKCYVNKTRFLKRVTFRKKGGETVTNFLTSGQKVNSVDEAIVVESGIKVSVIDTKPKRASKKDNEESTTDIGKE